TYTIGGRDLESAQTLFYAGVLQEKSDPAAAVQSYRKALEVQRKLARGPEVAQLLFRMGSLESRLGKEEEGLDALDEAAELQAAAKDEAGQAATLFTIGRILAHNHEHEDALEYLRQALSLKEKLKDDPGIAAVLFDLGAVQESRREYTKAL